MPTDVEVCNSALAMMGARDTITALNDGSNEANNCNLIFSRVRNQVLEMAPWTFARKTALLNLVKAAPGVPESPVQGASQWIPSYPAPPWLYEYQYPSDCACMRYICPQLGAQISGVPIFSTPQYTYFPNGGARPIRFVSATDLVGPIREISGITKANPAVVTALAHGFGNGQQVYVTGVIGMTEVNGRLFTIAGATTDTFQLSGENSSSYTSYVQGGVAVNQTQTQVRTRVLLANAPNAIGTYNMLITDLNHWNEGAIQALISALAGFLAIPLSGDKNMAKLMIEQANSHISSARTEDANEGLGFQETLPDWLAIRDSYSYNEPPYFNPWPNLFAVA